MMGKMKPRERLLAAMRHEETDYVPVSPRIMLDDIYGCSCWMHQLRAGKEFDYDPHIILGPQGPRASYIWYSFGPYDMKDVYVKLSVDMNEQQYMAARRIETPVGIMTDNTRFGRSQTWDSGVKSYYTPNPYKTEYLIKGPEDLEKFHYFITKLYEDYGPSNRLPDYHEVKEAVGEDGLVEYAVYGVIDHVYAYSSEDMMVAYYRDRKFLTDLLEIHFEPVMAETKAALEAGVEVIFTPWYFCSMSAGWSPKMYRDLFAPLLKKQVDLIHSYDALCDFYDDGKLMQSADIIAECGVDVLETLTPPPVGDVDLAKLKVQIGGKTCLKGYMDLWYVIHEGTPESIELEVKKAIETAAPGGGFILGTSDSIRPGTPIENIKAYFKAGRKYGKKGIGW